MLTLGEILSCKDTQSEVVSVPEWGGEVRVRALTYSERFAAEALFDKLKDKLGLDPELAWQAFWIVATMCDESGSLLCQGTPTAEAVKGIAVKASKPFSRVMRVVNRLNFITAAEVESAEKNSEAASSG